MEFDEELTNKYNKEPSVKEIADQLGLTEFEVNNASKLDFNFLNISAVLNIDRVKLKILAKKFAGMHNFTASYEFIDKNNNSFLFNKFLKISFPNNLF